MRRGIKKGTERHPFALRVTSPGPSAIALKLHTAPESAERESGEIGSEVQRDTEPDVEERARGWPLFFFPFLRLFTFSSLSPRPMLLLAYGSETLLLVAFD